MAEAGARESVGAGRPRLLPGQRCGVPLLVRGGAVRADGRVLSAAQVARRVGWLVGLTRGSAAGLVGAVWNEPGLASLAAGVDGSGRRLPGSAWMAARRLGWDAPVPAGVYLPDRVRRCVQEQAVRLLRSALYRRGVLSVVLATWPVDEAGGPSPSGRRDRTDWDALHAAARVVGVVTDTVTVRNLTREVARHLTATGNLPGSSPDLQAAPRPGAQVLLAAGDRQFATLVRSGDREALLTVTLPARADPQGRADWQPVVLRLPLPAHVPVDAVLRMPALRLTRRPDGRAVVHADLTFDRPAVLPGPASGHVKAMGFDWGVRTLLTGAFGSLPPTGRSSAGPFFAAAASTVMVRTTGRPVVFDAAGVADKLRLLRETGERVHRRVARHDDLLRGHAAGTVPPAALLAKRRVLVEELARVSARRRHLDAQLGRTAARWMVEQTVARACQVVCVRDADDVHRM